MSLRVGQLAPAAFADVEVRDAQGGTSRLGARWENAPAVVVFLRHFACIACTEHVSLLAPRLHELARVGVRVVYVGNGAPNFIAGFVERNGVNEELVEVVTDPDKASYRAAGMEHSRRSTYGPRSMLAFARARVRGFRQTAIEGDPLQQGGVVVLAAGGRVRFLHRDAHLGDYAATDEVVEAALQAVKP